MLSYEMDLGHHDKFGFIIGALPRGVEQRSAPDKKTNHLYFITLTTPDSMEFVNDGPSALSKVVHKVLDSKKFLIKDYLLCYELTNKGFPHCHILAWTDHYIAARDVFNMNHKNRVDVQIVKNINSVINYILKKKSTIEYTYFQTFDIDIFQYSQTCPVISDQLLALVRSQPVELPKL